MRLRNIPRADGVIAASPFVVQEPKAYRGRWAELFGNGQPIHIEVGMGKGKFLMELARRNPQINYIGIERYTSVLLRAVEKLQGETDGEEAPQGEAATREAPQGEAAGEVALQCETAGKEAPQGEAAVEEALQGETTGKEAPQGGAAGEETLQGEAAGEEALQKEISGEQSRRRNLYLLCMDAEELPEVFAPGEVEKIYLNFSDPWPKERHAKRRLPSRQFLERYDQILSPEGTVEFKTDNQDLFAFALEELEPAGWKLRQKTWDLHSDPVMKKDNIMTEYEEKFSAKGNPICKMIIYR